MQNNQVEKAQFIYARIAGFLYLFLIVTYMAGVLTLPGMTGSGDFAEVSGKIIASEQLYRIALSSQLITSVGTVLLAFSLYKTLKPVNDDLARMALYWRLGDAFVGGAGTIFSFMSLRLYTHPDYVGPFSTEQLQALVYFTHDAHGVTLDVASLFFTVGSTLFFYLFFKSRYIPRLLSAFGIFASALAFFMGFASLIFPEYAATIQLGGYPILIAEIATGAWLLFFGVRPRTSAA